VKLIDKKKIPFIRKKFITFITFIFYYILFSFFNLLILIFINYYVYHNTYLCSNASFSIELTNWLFYCTIASWLLIVILFILFLALDYFSLPLFLIIPMILYYLLIFLIVINILCFILLVIILIINSSLKDSFEFNYNGSTKKSFFDITINITKHLTTKEKDNLMIFWYKSLNEQFLSRWSIFCCYFDSIWYW